MRNYLIGKHYPESISKAEKRKFTEICTSSAKAVANSDCHSYEKKRKIKFFRNEISLLLLNACKLAVYTLACYTYTCMCMQAIMFTPGYISLFKKAFSFSNFFFLIFLFFLSNCHACSLLLWYCFSSKEIFLFRLHTCNL